RLLVVRQADRLLLRGLRLLDPLLDLPHSLEVLAELARVRRAELAAEPRGVLADEVEDALPRLVAPRPRLGGFGGRAAPEQPLEDQLRVDLLRHGGGLGLPGDVG